MRVVLFFILCVSSYVSGEIAEPYHSIVDLPYDSHGWFDPSNAEKLQSMIASSQPKVAIEVGSWLGCSARFIASHMPEEGVLYAVDTWKGSTNEEQHMNDPRLSQLYQLFLSNVKHAKLTHKIVPIRMTSLEASRALNVMADLIYIDASHDTESVTQDIMAWSEHLNQGGTLCGDDWGHGPVQTAVMNCAPILNKKVMSYGNFWWYED